MAAPPLADAAVGVLKGLMIDIKKTRNMRANLFNLGTYEHLGSQPARPHLNLYSGNYHAKA